MKLLFNDGKQFCFILFKFIIIHFANFQLIILILQFTNHILHFNQKQNLIKIILVYQVILNLVYF